MAVDSDAVGNGITITGVKSAFNNANNTAPDQTSRAVQATILKPVIDLEVEKFRSKGTTAASITFSQTVAHSAETWYIQIEYGIYTSP